MPLYFIRFNRITKITWKVKSLKVINIINDIKMFNQMMMFIQNTLCKVFRELGNPNKYKMWDFPIGNLFNWSILKWDDMSMKKLFYL